MVQIQGQPINFNDPTCEDFCVNVANNLLCGDYVLNPTFENLPLTGWTLVNGTQSFERILTSDGSSNADISQVIELDAGNWTIFYNFNSATNLILDLTLTNGPTAATVFDTSLGNDAIGTYTMTITGASTRTLLLEFTTASGGQFVGINYLYICRTSTALVPETDFCFQIPLFDSGAGNLLSLTGDSVDLLEGFDDTTDQNKTPDTLTAGGVCGTVNADKTNHFAGTVPTATNVVGEDGQYFIEYTFGGISLDYTENYIDETPKRLAIQTIGNGGAGMVSDDYFIKESDANSSVLFLDSNTWQGSVIPVVPPAEELDVWYKARYACDGTNERVKFDVDITNFRMIGNFLETTFTAANDTFYRLKYTNAKTSSSTVKIYNSTPTLIYQADSDGVGFDKVFKTGTLPSTTVTIRFEVSDLTEFPNANYELDVITDVNLQTQCTYSVDLETTASSSVQTLTETHDTVSEAKGSTYHQNIMYCLDLNTVVPAQYHFRATSSCVGTEQEVSNKIVVLNGNCAGTKQLSWNHQNKKTIGNYTLDGETYDYTSFAFIKCDLQDMSIEEDREVYVGADGFFNVAWARQQESEILQIWPVPNFMRKAIAVAMMDVFYIDGVAYTKTDADEFTPQFAATYNSPTRITVHKVGANTTSRN